MSDECQHETICSDCGAMTTGYAALTARAEAAEQQAARLREALAWYADEANYDQDEYDHENVPGEMVDSDKVCSRCHLRGCREFFEPDRGGRARAALAASQPAPAVEATDEEAWPRVEAVLSWFAEFIEEEPPIELPTLNQRARAVYAAFNAYSKEIRSGPYRGPRGGQAEEEG